MRDLISREAEIDAMDTCDKFGCDQNGMLVRYDDNKHYVPYVRYDDMVYTIKNMPSVDPWSAVKILLNELEQKQERLYANYCDSTARLNAINKIAESSQTPKQKLEGIRPLAEQGVSE